MRQIFLPLHRIKRFVAFCIISNDGMTASNEIILQENQIIFNKNVNIFQKR